MILCATSKLHIYLVIYHIILGTKYRERLVRIIFWIFHLNYPTTFQGEKIIIMTPRNWPLNVTKLHKDWAKNYWLAHVVTCKCWYLVTLRRTLLGLAFLKSEMHKSGLVIRTTALEQLRSKG